MGTKKISYPTTRTISTKNSFDWDAIFRSISSAIGRDYTASVNRIAAETPRPDPFRVLVSTVISLRTKDDVTFAASDRLFARASTPEEMQNLTPPEIETLIYPAGFFRNKSRQIAAIADTILNEYGGVVPQTIEELVALPGVGRKTANLVLGVGFGIPSICVDIHVHRISNRLGWVETATPEQTEFALMDILPERFWIPINEALVGFGQKVCTPQSPWCSRCPFSMTCPRNGVARSR